MSHSASFSDPSLLFHILIGTPILGVAGQVLETSESQHQGFREFKSPTCPPSRAPSPYLPASARTLLTMEALSLARIISFSKTPLFFITQLIHVDRRGKKILESIKEKIKTSHNTITHQLLLMFKYIKVKKKGYIVKVAIFHLT